ncbi:hypothetical protein SAMN02927916_4318 [Flavobacterium anhuiense]|uniref:Uncharacterized protein n=1 Tax=Flavobacterium anhuiense TaxID=459526 RepID=A0ABY0M348_9FLAO|nr:hypothetical protein SAMN02927916_4318 [Flavobacterium anhuiense]
MRINKNILLFLLTLSLFYLGLTLSWIFKKEDFTDIKICDFKYSIVPLLSSIAIFIGYITELKKSNK